ncbi:sugar phosphate isomerase/epimerase family protein [Maribacter sp. HTCC2170]|uniref:sugar phosphate isomerase/epimerase family protein n=1 Tax=Maribacter sp. (strain HTCC2170 / KCCM 42371) TaxID=313603 RepID=UPI00006B480E|nr:TIM barrel protein [Maribacter sp. HTCC2170]EAR01692.1 hypothetical protein FB2170_14228 [Maribacter sp. HTCC2170]
MTTRRSFIKKSAVGTTAATLLPFSTLASCSSQRINPKISLAQWSLNKAFFAGELNPEKFASIARKDYNISAIEYVNAFYRDSGNDEKFWHNLKQNAENEDVKSLLIMVDDEGDLGNPNESERKKAVENHYKWINAAKILGCHSIRVNAFGKGDNETVGNSLVDGLGALSEYGQKEGINVLIENHGLHTSNANFIVDIIKKVNNPNLGTLPDFGNWCLNKEWGSTQNNACTDVYDRYKGLEEFLPYAKGVSAKSYDFDELGNETIMDYSRLLKTVKDSDFKGYIGIEYEGERLSPTEGIKATKNLIEHIWSEL